LVDIFVVVRVGYDPVGSVRMLLVMDRWTVWKEETRLRNIVVVDMTPLPNLCPPNFTIVLAPLSQLSHGPHPSKSVRSAKMMIDDDAQTMVYLRRDNGCQLRRYAKQFHEDFMYSMHYVL